MICMGKFLDKHFGLIFSILLLAGLYSISLHNYLLFHSFAEIYVVVIAAAIFVLAVNSKQYLKNKYLFFLGIAYLFIGFLDLLHTLSYNGMGIFTDYDYYANQVWIATRYIESISLLLALLFIYNDKLFNEKFVFISYAVVTCLVVLSIFIWKIFPICFVEGKGLTNFKKISEYIICLILLVDVFFLFRFKKSFSDKVYKCLVCSILLTIGSELCFTFYVSNYGFSNLVGHYLKIFSFFLIYKALVKTGIKEPFKIIFKDLTDKQKALEELSFKDHLTNLLNRRAFLEKLEYEQAKTERNFTPNSLIIADIDFFKKINDNYGHDVGDDIIRGVADIFRNNVRKQDSVCRWGGEEFLILLPESDLEMAATTAEKLRTLVESHTFVVRANIIRCTLSFGVAQLMPGRSHLESVRVSDANLYQSKARGRNRVTAEECPDLMLDAPPIRHGPPAEAGRD